MYTQYIVVNFQNNVENIYDGYVVYPMGTLMTISPSQSYVPDAVE